MNEKILETLEFQRIKDQLAKYLASATGKQELAELMPQSDYETVLSWQKETMDGADILRLKGGMPIPKLADVRPQMKRLKIKASLNGA